MSDETPVGEALLDQVSQGGEPGKKTEPQGNVSGSVEDRLGHLEKLVAGIPGQLDEGFKRLKQSQRDTVDDRVNRVKSTLEADILERVKPHLEKAGVNLDEVRRQAFLDRQIEGFSTSTQNAGESPQAEPAPQPSGPSVVQREISSILEKHGLDGKEPELREYMRQHQGEPWYRAGAGFAELAESLAARKQSGTVMPGGGSAPPAPNLVDAYRKEVLEARSRGEGMSGKRRIDEKYRKLGFNPDNVRWTL